MGPNKLVDVRVGMYSNCAQGVVETAAAERIVKVGLKFRQPATSWWAVPT